MIKVVIRHVTWEKGIEIDEFLPSEVKSIVKLIEEFGAFAADGLEDYSYHNSRYDIDNQCFEILID